MADPRGYVSQRELDELKELMERVDEPEAKIAQTLKVAAANPDTYENLREMYSLKAAQVATKDAFYPYEDLDGQFVIGETPDGEALGLTGEHLNEHMLLVGKTGSGKTTFFYNLMDLLADADLPFLVFDFKHDYRHLIDEHDLLVINWENLKFNPLEPPPGVQPGNWGEILSDTFAHATDLLIGSESYFLEKLRVLYDLYEVEATGRYPSLFELRDLVAADEISQASPKFRYKERVSSRLTMMTGFSGDIFDCSSGYPLEDLLERNVVIELKQPNQYVTNFVVETLLTWIYYYRDAIGQRQGLEHMVLFDEAKRVFDVNRERQPESGYPPIDDLVGQVREFGEGLVVADHEPSKLTDSIKANTQVKLWLTLGSGADVEEMAQTFGLDRDEVDFTRTMETGEALLKLADQDPVPIILPDYTVEKEMTGDDLRMEMAPELSALPTRERFRPSAFKETIGETVDADVSEVTEALLVSVTEQPFLSMAERYEAIGVGSKKGNEAKNKLVTLDLVREVEISTGRPGRNPKLLELTSRGRDVLEDRGYTVAETARGGIEHRWWQHQVTESYEEDGFRVSVEHAVGQQHIDVYAVRGDEAVAVEVALSPEHEVANVRKCLDHDVDRVQVVYTDTDVKETIRDRLQDEMGTVPDPVEFVQAAEFS
jgi:uncharacterized protein (DUF2249 family)